MNNIDLAALQNLEDFNRGSRINNFEKVMYGGNDYDYAIAGLAGLLARDRSKGQHGSDIGKLPNHPTFSDQSVYSTPNYRGGKWSEQNGQWVFTPSQDMMRNNSIAGLAEYFSRYEPNIELKAPVPYNKNFKGE